MKQFVKELVKLLKVKSIISITTTFVFAYLCIKGIIDGDKFLIIFSTIIGFYYGTQATKN